MAGDRRNLPLLLAYTIVLLRTCQPTTVDYCWWEDDWLLSCPLGQVIVTQKALFGRMKTGRCIKEEEFIGCENDVLFAVDRLCSGRQKCDVQKDNIIVLNKDCRSYLQMYISVDYICVQATGLQVCSTGNSVLIGEKEGFLSSHLTAQTGCGSSDSPWKIVALPGQTIELGIIDFGSEISGENYSDTYGYITDGKQRIPFGKGDKRERPLYNSRTNSLQIVVKQMSAKQDNAGFIIHFRKLGCPDLSPPAHAWYKRDGDQAVIGCEWSQKTWHLSCDGESWSGVVGNCSGPVTEGMVKEEAIVNMPSALWLVCLISASTVVIVIVCVVGVVCVRKYRIKQDIQKSSTLQRMPGQGHYDLDPNIEMASMLYLPYKSTEQQQQQQQQQQATPSEPNRPTSYLIPQDQVVTELTPIRIWERPLPDIPDKPLGSATECTYPINQHGRTPGDGDETVGDNNKQESDAFQI